MNVFVKVDSANTVFYIHNKPFDDEFGLGKTKEELLKEGYLVESIPDQESEVGKTSIYSYHIESNSVTIDYVDRPLTSEEETLQLKARLDATENALLDLLLGGM